MKMSTMGQILKVKVVSYIQLLSNIRNWYFMVPYSDFFIL